MQNSKYLGPSLVVLLAILASLTVFLPANFALMLLGSSIVLAIILVLISHPEWGIYLLTIFIPLEEFIEKWLPSGVVFEVARFGGEALLFLLFFVVLLECARRGYSWYATPLDKPLLAFLGVTLISAILNNTPILVAILGIRPLLRYTVAFYIITQLRTSSRFFQRWLMLCLTLATIVATIGLLQTIIGEPLTNFLIPNSVVIGGSTVREGLRHTLSPRTYIFSTMGRYDTLGVFLWFFLLIAFTTQAFATSHTKRRIWLFIAIGFVALLLTFSRQSWLALILSIGIVILFANRQKFRKTKWSYVLGILIVPIIVLISLPYAQYFGSSGSDITIVERFLEPFSQRYLSVSRYSYGRLFVILSVGPRLLELSPIYGLGPGQFGSLTTQFFGIQFADLVGVPENAAPYINDVNWVVLLGQLGLAGVITFSWLFLTLAKTAFRLYQTTGQSLVKGAALGYMAGLFVYLFLGFLGPNFEVRQISFFVWVMGGLLTSLYQQEQWKTLS